MPKPSQIADLVSHVYGPYADYVILNDTFPQIGMTLPIRELQMYCNGEPIGFDQTEFIGQLPATSPIARNQHVIFFGILEIQSLDCLSEQGLDFLEKDVRDYDAQIHMAHAQSGVTLRTLYGQRKGEGSRIKVRISCNKNMLANFLTTKNDPEKFIIYSSYEGRKRRFWVQSLHALTFLLSRNFFDRYRLRALIEELIDTDPDKTPLEERNIDWLVRRYLTTIHPRDADNRIISDPTLDFDISSEPRHVRHISRAEIRGYFASQAEWLLAHQLASSSKRVRLLDIYQWISFCQEARKDSIKAKKEGVRWGVPHGWELDMTGPHNLARNLAKFGYDEKFWANKLKVVQKKREKAKKMPRSKQLFPEVHLPEDIVQRTIQFQYDSDFSEPSTPEASDSDLEPSLSGFKVPEFCLEAPQISSGRFTWNCPGCNYQIDLLNLSPPNLGLLPQDTMLVLSGKSWNVNDKPIQKALFLMVSDHYKNQHLSCNAVRVQSQGSKWRLEDSRSPLKTGLQKGIYVKVEESEGGLVQLRRSSRTHRPPRRPA